MAISQAEWIVAAIVAGFLLFLAIKGKLGNYWRLLTGGGKAAAPAVATPAGGVAGAAAAGAATLATGAAGAAAIVPGGLKLPALPQLIPF